MEYPFPFLLEASPGVRDRVHEIILSSDAAWRKHSSIQDVIPPIRLDQYLTWLRQQEEKKIKKPPSEMLDELPAKDISYLFELIGKGELCSIRYLFVKLTSETREKAEKWLTTIRSCEQLREAIFIEAKDKLLQLGQKERGHDSEVNVAELTEKFEALSTNSNEARSPTKSLPKVSDLIQKNPPNEIYNTTYRRDFGSSNGTNNQPLYSEVASRGNSVHREENRPGRMETNGYAESTQKRPTNGHLRNGTCPGISNLNPSSHTEEMFYASNKEETPVSNNHVMVQNCKEIQHLSETLKETLDKTSTSSCHNKSTQKPAQISNGTANPIGGDQQKPRDDSPILCPAPRVELDYSLEDIDPENIFNILLLGETGVGKTTFINSFANYVKYESLDEALEKNPVILIKSSITQTMNGKDGNTEMKQRTITVEANYGDGVRTSENENFADGGESRTQEPLIHSIPWEEDRTTKLLRIIDTPGVNDTRGEEQDEANFDKILSLIGKLGRLNAICILLKPNESTLSMGFRNCLDNVLIKLHRSATNNILFCFTNTRSTLYRPGDTMAPLCIYLKELEAATGVMITPNKHNIFCFDNDCFRYLCVLLKLPNARGEKTHAALSAGWIHNIKECKKLLDKIQGLVAHQVEDTVNINNARRFLTAMARPLTEIAQNHILNRRMMEKQIKQVRELREKGESLGALVERKEWKISKKDLPFPRTVCTNSKCCEIFTGSDGIDYIPKIICHDNCTVTGYIPPSAIGHKSLSSCIYLKSGNCDRCGCSIKFHMHMTYEIEKKLVHAASLADRAEFKMCTDNKQKAQLVLKDLENKLANIQNEFELIKETSFEFSAFLQYSSLKSGTDPYFDFLNTAIEGEKNMAEHRGDKTLLLDLKALLKEYNKGVSHHLEELKAKRRPPLTTAEMWAKVDNLSRMKLSGSLIADVAKAVRDEQHGNSQ